MLERYSVFLISLSIRLELFQKANTIKRLVPHELSQKRKREWGNMDKDRAIGATEVQKEIRIAGRCWPSSRVKRREPIKQFGQDILFWCVAILCRPFPSLTDRLTQSLTHWHPQDTTSSGSYSILRIYRTCSYLCCIWIQPYRNKCSENLLHTITDEKINI